MNPRVSWSALVLLLALSPVALTSCDEAAMSAQGVVVHAPDFKGRLEAAVTHASTETLGTEARKSLEQATGIFLVDAPNKVRGLPEAVTVQPLLGDPAVVELLIGSDEAALADKLLEQKVQAVVVHWRLQSAIDRGGRVASRLFHHDELNRFQLQRITDELLIYKVLEAPVVFPPQLAAAVTMSLRSLLTTGRGIDLSKVPPPRDGEWELMASVRGQGRELGIGLAHGKNLNAVMLELARDIERIHRRYHEWDGFPPIQQNMKDLTIEVHRITERAPVEPRGETDLEDLWEMGIDGAIIRDFEARKVAVFPGSVSYTRGLRAADQFLRHAADFHGFEEKRPWRDADISLEMVRDQEYREMPGKGLVFLYRGQPPVPMELATLDNTRTSILSAADWWLYNMKPDGSVVYKWWPAENRESNEYNIVRHALATWNLALAYRLDPRQEYIDGAIKAQDFTLKFLKEEGDMAYVDFNDVVKLGTVVVGLLGMIEVARITGDHSNDELMRKWANFTLFMQEDSGKFRPYYVDDDHPYANQVNDIVPGEAALALVELSKYFNDPQYIEPLKKYWEYYEPWYYERATKRHDDAPWPTMVYDNDTRLELVQFGPWSVMAANAYHEVTGDENVAKFGLDIAHFMIDSYEWTEETAPFPDYVGGYYKLPYELPAMQAFCYAEGTAAAYALSLRARPEESAYYEKATRETVRFAMQMQFDDLNTYAFSRPAMAHGGIRYAMNETKIRIDYVHHALSAMYQYYQAAQNDPNLPESVKADVPTLVERLAQAQAAAEARQAELAAQGEAQPAHTLMDAPVSVPLPGGVFGGNTEALREDRDGEE
ncbi:MAG: hypothetical protein ABIO70_06295 [Pseudomonadota bacterium]